MAKLVCVEDYENYAIRNLTPIVKDYYASGAGQEHSLKLNREAFKRYIIRPRMMKNVSKRNTGVIILGKEISMPIGIAPTAMQRMAHPDGECANAKAAEELGTIFILSTISTSSIEEIAEAAPKAIKWFQLYIYRDRTITINLIKRVENSGFQAIVLTIDAPIFGNRRADLRNNFVLPQHLRLANFDGYLSKKINTKNTDGSGLNEYVKELFDDSLTWDDITWLKSITKLPIIVKGIITKEDALLAVERGVDAIIVSNHGARQIDGVPATIQALPEIVRSVKNKVEIYIDGGIVQGTDIFKALALGAKMVFLGRPMLWGLFHNGQQGAVAILRIMKQEFDHILALTGCTCPSDISKDMIVHESYYSHL